MHGGDEMCCQRRYNLSPATNCAGATKCAVTDVGLMLCLRLLFAIGLMAGRIDGWFCFRMFVGSGSQQHNCEFPSIVSFDICSSDTLWE